MSKKADVLHREVWTGFLTPEKHLSFMPWAFLARGFFNHMEETHMQTVEHVYAETQILNWLAKENGIACMPPYQYLVEGELWEVDVVSTSTGGYKFAVGAYHAHGAEEVVRIMKREANKA